MSDKEHEDRADWLEGVETLREKWTTEETPAEEPAAPDLEKAVRRLSWRALLRWMGLALVVAVVFWAVGLAGWWVWRHRPLPPPGTVKGQVVALDGTPLPGVVVSVEDIEGVWTTTQTDGTFVLPGVPGGNRWLLIEIPNRSGVSLPVQVKSGQEVDIGTVQLWR